MSGKEEHLGSLPCIETGRPPPGKLLFRRNYLYAYSGVKNVYVHIEYTLIYWYVLWISLQLNCCNFLFLPLCPAVKKKRRNVAALTFVGNKSTPNITPLLLSKQ